MISHIYVNGDSYSALKKEYAVYSKCLEEKTNIPSINQATVGSSNDRIFRTTLEHITSLDKKTKPFVIIGFSFVTREETWVDNIEQYKHRIRDYPGSQFVSLDWLQKSDIDDNIKHLIIDQNINKQMIGFYTKLFMLSQTLQNLNIPYLLFSGADNMDFRNLNWSSLQNLTMFNWVVNDSNIFDFKTFNIPLWAKQQSIKTELTGHLLADGHELFAEFLLRKIKDRL